MSEPWQCPRCGKINAPFNPSCFCRPKEEKQEEPKIPYTQYIPDGFLDGFKKLPRCSNCNGIHGVWNGSAVQCINLRS